MTFSFLCTRKKEWFCWGI